MASIEFKEDQKVWLDFNGAKLAGVVKNIYWSAKVVTEEPVYLVNGWTQKVISGATGEVLVEYTWQSKHEVTPGRTLHRIFPLSDEVKVGDIRSVKTWGINYWNGKQIAFETPDTEPQEDVKAKIMELEIQASVRAQYRLTDTKEILPPIKELDYGHPGEIYGGVKLSSLTSR